MSAFFLSLLVWNKSDWLFLSFSVPRSLLSFETPLIICIGNTIYAILLSPYIYIYIFFFLFDAVFWPILFTNTFSITLKPFFSDSRTYNVMTFTTCRSSLTRSFHECSLYFALFIFSLSLLLLRVISSNFSFRFKSRLFSIILHFFLLNKLAIIYSWQKNQRGGHTLSDKAAAIVQKGIKFHLWPIHFFINAAKCY